MKKLEGKVAIITGGAGGMGMVHAKRFVEEGAKVVLTDINAEKGEELADKLGENALFIKHDVTKEEEWEKVIKQTEDYFGPVNVLVNNAGIVSMGFLRDLNIEDYKRVIDINQTSVVLGMKTVLPSMEKTGNGSIVNISSIEGLVGGPSIAAYVASKYAVRGLTKVAAAEFAAYGIRVNSVHPGVIDTPMIHLPGVKEEVEKLVQTIPMKRVANAEEVTNLVLFLASDDSSYSTGSEFVIDGGLTPF